MMEQLEQKTSSIRCGKCRGTSIREHSVFIDSTIVRKILVCANIKCDVILDYNDTKLSCDCGNTNFTIDYTSLIGDGMGKDYNEFAVVCSGNNSCGKVLDYVEDYKTCR